MMNIFDFAKQYRLRRPVKDDCGDFNFVGQLGDIYENGDGFFLATILRGCWRKYREEAKQLGCVITQNGDFEGTFKFDPANVEQVKLAIRATRQGKRRILSPEHREILARAASPHHFQPRKTQTEVRDDARVDSTVER